MRSLAPYTHVILRGICHYKAPNSTSVLPSRAVNTNAKRLRLCRQPSLQPADILADIPADIPPASQTKISKEEKVDIIKGLLH